MMQLRILLLAVRPSWISFGFVGTLTLLIFGFTNWSFLTTTPLLYDTFYGEGGIVTTLERSPDAISAIQTSVTTSPVVYGVGLIGLALIAALVVFVSIRSIEHGVSAFARRGADAPMHMLEWRQRLFERIGIFALWAVYVLFTINAAVPFCLLLARIGIEDTEGLMAVFMTMGATALLFVVLHMHIVFARLISLRPRVFGGEVAIESLLIH